MTAGTEEILDRCQSGKDDIGFVYVSEEQMPSFQYRLECGKLEFQELKRTKAYLYFGKEHPLAGKQSIEEIPRDQVRLVQCYEDVYKRQAPAHAAIMPMISANAPESGDSVACRIAGNVITASVTYGT